MIVPQTFKKVLLTKEGTIKTERFTVSGRKIPLLEITTRMLKEHESPGLLRIQSDDYYTSMINAEVRTRLMQLGEDATTGEESEIEAKERLKAMERKRHLMIWDDNSTLLNHGHLLLTVNSVYDEALYFTNEEMKANGKGDIDIVRFFHGDGPQQQFEAGEQKGGNAGCASCSGDARMYKDLAVSFSRPHLTLSERLKNVLQGPAGKNKRNAGLKPFKDLRLEELRDECRARGLESKGQKKELQEILKEEIGGIQRVPAMMFFDQEKKLADLALGKHCILSNTNVVNINK